MKILLLLSLLISNQAFADQLNTDTNSGFSSIIMFVILFVLMYFLLIRPQTKKAKEHKTLIESLKINDEVMTNAGIIGKIKKTKEQFIILSLNENIDIIIKKEAIASILPKGTIKEII